MIRIEWDIVICMMGSRNIFLVQEPEHEKVHVVEHEHGPSLRPITVTMR